MFTLVSVVLDQLPVWSALYFQKLFFLFYSALLALM